MLAVVIADVEVDGEYVFERRQITKLMRVWEVSAAPRQATRRHQVFAEYRSPSYLATIELRDVRRIFCAGISYA